MGGARNFLIAAFVAALAGAGSARADGVEGAKAAEAAAPSSRSHRTVLHFGEDDISGDITRPDGELVQAPRRVNESSLLRVRRSFVDRALSGVARGQ